MASQIIQTFGQYIKHLRTSGGYTLTQLAAKLGMDSANLSKVENDKREFDEKKLPVLCKVFDLNLNEIQKELISEKIAKKVYATSVDTDVLVLAEKKVEYMKQKKIKQSKIKF